MNIWKEGERTKGVATMAEISERGGMRILNETILVAPLEVCDTAFALQPNPAKAADYLYNCFLVYRDCTLNHVRQGIALQEHEGVFEWLTPADFSWSDTERVAELAEKVKVRETEEIEQYVEGSVPIFDLGSRKLLHYQKLPELDRQIPFVIPYRVAFADPQDWTRTTASFLVGPGPKIKEYLGKDGLAEHASRQLLLQTLEGLRKPTTC